MEQQPLSEELAPRETAITRRSKPTLKTLDNGQQISSDGKFHPDLAVDYMRHRGRIRYVTIGECAKVFYHANIPKNKARVRRCIPPLARRLILSGELLVRDIDPKTRRVMAMKLYDPRSEQDRQGVRGDLERMRSRRELTDELFCRALALVERKEAELLVEPSC